MQTVQCPLCQKPFQTPETAAQVVCPHCQQTVQLRPAAPAQTWYVLRNQRQTGPFSLAQMQQMAQSDQVRASDLVWREGMADWRPARDMSELAGHLLVETAPAGPPPPRDGEPRRYRDDEPGRPYRQAPPGEGFWAHFGVNLLRGFTWNLDRITPSDAERRSLLEQGVDEPIMQKYLTWRRGVFLVVAIASSLSALIHFIGFFFVDRQGLSGFGILTQVMLLLAQFVLPSAAWLGCICWARYRLTHRLIVTSWTVAYLSPMLVAIFPLRWLVQLPPDEAQRRAAEGALGAVGLILGIAYFIALMPTVLSLIPGVLRAALRIKTLLPQSVLTGWFLLAGVPLYGLLLLVTFIMINQIAGNALLILGIVLFIGAPMTYLFGARLFIQPLTGEGQKKVVLLQIICTGVASFAALLLVIYLFTGTMFGQSLMGFSSATSVFRPWQLLQFYIEFIGRSLFTTTVVADLLLAMNFSLWFHLRRFDKTEESEAYDQTMTQLGKVLYPAAEERQ